MSEEPVPLSDEDLVARVAGGESSLFEELIRRRQKQIFRIAFSIVQDEMEADIVTQDTFVQAYLHLSGFEQRSKFETWLTRIAINRSRDSLRARRRAPLQPSLNEEGELLFDPADGSPDAERQMMSHQLRGAIEQCVASLSKQQQVIFRLRHYEEMALEQIATLMELSPGTVRAHLFRAIHKLRKELGTWLDRGPSAGKVRG